MRTSQQPPLTPVLPNGFEAIYEAQYDFLWRSARRLGVGTGELEDVVQDSFVIALRRFDDFDHEQPGRASSWLFSILRNVVRNRNRSDRRRQARHDAYAAGELLQPPGSKSATEAGLAWALLHEFLASLDANKREAFVLGELEGLSGAELGEALGVNCNTASSRLRAARQAFAQRFDVDAPAHTAAALRERSLHERAPRGARARSLPAIALAAGFELGSARTVGLGLGLLSSKLLAGLIALASLFGTAAILVHEPASERVDDADMQGDAPVLASAPASPAAKRAEAEVRAAKLELPPESPRQASAGKPHNKSNGDSGGSAQVRELERLGEARQALVAGEAERTLEILGQQQFGASLEGRRIALEVAALCDLGRRESARERANAWALAHAGDPVAATLANACPNDKSR